MQLDWKVLLSRLTQTSVRWILRRLKVRLCSWIQSIPTPWWIHSLAPAAASCQSVPSLPSCCSLIVLEQDSKSKLQSKDKLERRIHMLVASAGHRLRTSTSSACLTKTKPNCLDLFEISMRLEYIPNRPAPLPLSDCFCL